MANIFKILNSLKLPHKVYGATTDGEFNSLKSVFNARPDSLVFIDIGRRDYLELVNSTKASVIITSNEYVEQLPEDTKSYILVDNPKLVFTKIAALYNKNERKPCVHSSAIIDETSIIHPTASIGAYTVIGKHCYIGANSIIHPNVTVYDNVKIECSAEIHSSSVIGMPGFGFIPDENGEQINFPHIGGVHIHDRVVVGSGCMICQGALGDTIIGENTKVDNLVHIAHNVKIGRNCLIVANAMIGGSSIIGDNVWIGPSVNIRDGIFIDTDSSVTMGSTATKGTNKGDKVTGYFATDHTLFMKKYLKALKST